MAAFAKRYLKYRDEPYGKREALLWPVYVYRIMYPAERGTKLDLFQLAVMGLARTGCHDPAEVSELLGLHQEMILLIVARCISAGWLNHLGQPTEKGLALLEDGEDKSLCLKSGLLFRDAVSGALWPRIASEQPEIEALSESGAFPVFKLNRSSGQNLRPFVLRHKVSTPPCVINGDALEAYRAYRLDHFNAKQLYGSGALPEQIRAHGIELMEEQPEPMYVMTWIAEDPSGTKPWLICDPFDIRQQVPWLESPFTEALPQQTSLVRKIAGFVGVPEPQNQNVEEWMRSMEHTIDMELLTEHSWACRQDLIARYYSSVQRRLLLIDQGLGKHELDATLADSQKLCEAVCQWILREFKPDMGIFPRVQTHERDVNKSILNALELPALTPKVINVLAGQNLKQVRNVLEGRNQSLKAMLFGALLSTLGSPNHPLKKVSPEKLALEKLLALADARNEATHASGKEFKQDEVVQWGKFAQNWMLLFKEWM